MNTLFGEIEISNELPKRKGIGGHQSSKSISNEYVTPLEIITALGTFDLDPCAPIIRPWDTAKIHYTITDNGLTKSWGNNRVWLNPPYSNNEVTPWLKLMSMHLNGTVLIFNRSDRSDHHKYMYPFADSMFIRNKRITFCDIYGKPYHANGGAPNIFFAFGERDSDALADSGFKGQHISLNKTHIIVVGVSPTWISVVSIAVRNFGDKEMQPIYEMVERIAPDKISKNKYWREKVRQKIQMIRKIKKENIIL